MVSHDESLLSKTSGLNLSRFYNRCIDSLILMFLPSIFIISSAEDEPTKLLLLKIGFYINSWWNFLGKFFHDDFGRLHFRKLRILSSAKNWIKFNGERELQTRNVGYLNIREKIKFLTLVILIYLI